MRPVSAAKSTRGKRGVQMQHEEDRIAPEFGER
jgi:hypothetical protein